MSQDQSTAVLERLVSAGVLVETPDGAFTIDDKFAEKRTAIRKDLQADGRDVLDPKIADLDLPERVLADASALALFSPSLATDTAVSVAWSLKTFDRSVSTSGVPEGFVPLKFGEIESFVSQFEATIVYLWREKCDPCDLVRSDLEGLLEDGDFPDWMGRAAVYGPDCASELASAYDVGGAPTILFWVGDSIDCRFVGAKARETIEREIQTITELRRTPNETAGQ